MKVWSWREAVQKASLSSTTKLVLHNLSVHMDATGDGCYPSTVKQARDTGLSERSVCTHLELAAAAGFITVHVHGFNGRKWKRHQYYPRYPQGTELGSAPRTQGTEPDANEALKDVQSNSPIVTPPEKRFFLWKKLSDLGALAAKRKISQLRVPYDIAQITRWYEEAINEGRRVFPAEPEADFLEFIESFKPKKGKRS